MPGLGDRIILQSSGGGPLQRRVQSVPIIHSIFRVPVCKFADCYKTRGPQINTLVPPNQHPGAFVVICSQKWASRTSPAEVEPGGLLVRALLLLTVSLSQSVECHVLCIFVLSVIDVAVSDGPRVVLTRYPVS